MFRPGVSTTNGYNRSLLLLSTNGGSTLFLDSTVIVEEQKMLVQGGWRIDATLMTNSLTSLPFLTSDLFVQPPLSVDLAGFDPVSLLSRFFHWKLFPVPGLAGLIETALFAAGAVLFIFGAGLLIRTEPMEVGRLFLGWLLWVFLLAGPIFFLQYVQSSLLTRKAAQGVPVLFVRGGGLLLLGVITLIVGWKRYLHRLPPDVRRSL